jgi:ribosomal protein S18 acetylase RimI-like enzyme
MTQTETNTTRATPGMVRARRARAAEKEQILATIARAFDDDPFVNWAVAQDKRRARRVYDFMELAYTTCARHNEIYTADGTPGAAYWAPPGKHHLGLLQQVRLIPAMVRSVTARRMPTVSRGFNAVEKLHPNEPHWYLSVLGVDPEKQGQGIGTALMRPVLEMCDRDGTPAYLESSKEKNVPLYERNGFRVTRVFEIPGGGPPIWMMWREPQ